MAQAFVIHLHEGHGPPHYDLMLECAEALATWRLLSRPEELPPSGAMDATRLPDHRMAFLTYEGPISGGRGRVTRIDRGTYEPVEANPARWEFRLAGEACRGRFELCREADQQRWTLRRLPPEADAP